jgi:hypothetical protein
MSRFKIGNETLGGPFMQLSKHLTEKREKRGADGCIRKDRSTTARLRVQRCAYKTTLIPAPQPPMHNRPETNTRVESNWQMT